MLGEVALARGDPATAARHLGASQAIADKLGMRPLAERCRDSLNRLPAQDPGHPPG